MSSHTYDRYSAIASFHAKSIERAAGGSDRARRVGRRYSDDVAGAAHGERRRVRDVEAVRREHVRAVVARRELVAAADPADEVVERILLRVLRDRVADLRRSER